MELHTTFSWFLAVCHLYATRRFVSRLVRQILRVAWRMLTIFLKTVANRARRNLRIVRQTWYTIAPSKHQDQLPPGPMFDVTVLILAIGFGIASYLV